LKKVLSASSYGYFTATKEFRSQCHILLVLMEGALDGAFKGTFKGNFERQPSLVNLRRESGAHEAPYVALLTRVPEGITQGEKHSGAFIY